MLIYAMLQTIELWIFLGILFAAIVVEEIVVKIQQQKG